MTEPLVDILLPWPDKVLHPNARVHWSAKMKVTKAARADACRRARSARYGAPPLPAGRLHLWLDFYPPDRRRRDDDGMLSSMKAARDGIADALGIDDSRFISHPMLHLNPVKGGSVRVRITEGPAW